MPDTLVQEIITVRARSLSLSKASLNFPLALMVESLGLQCNVILRVRGELTIQQSYENARVAELVDALDLGSSIH